MRKAFIITIVLALIMVLGTSLSYARQGGRGYGQGGGNCPYRQAAVTSGEQQSQSGWYCPRSGTWTNVGNHYGPMRSSRGQGYNWMSGNRVSTNK